MIDVVCEECGKHYQRYPSEVGRRGGRNFCSLSCAAVARNRPGRVKEVVKVCPHCDLEFVTTTHNKAPKFCSRSCASLGSLTERRRKAQSQSGKRSENLLSPVETLKKREAWKYESLRSKLEKLTERHEFEFQLPKTKLIFDLALLDRKVLVEFDGPDHREQQQMVEDRKKELTAIDSGWRVVRVPVKRQSVIPTRSLVGIVW